MVALPRKLKSLEYALKAQPYALEKPIVVQFPVIDICNSRCQMCRIWENKKSDDITPEKLREGLRNPLFSEVASVGLNGGEPTLRKDLGELTQVLFDELPRLKTIALITNSYRYREVIDRITDVGTIAKRYGAKLDLMCSLDGYGEVHEAVRGRPTNFMRARKVIEFAKSSPLVDELRIGCTIIRENVYGLHDLLEFCQREGLYVKYRLGVPHQRLYTSDLVDPYALTFEERYHVAEFLEGLIAHYEPGEHQNHFYRSLIGQIMHDRPRAAGCDWQHRGATITSKGELLYCAVQSKSLGLIQEVDSEEAFFSNAPHLAEIRANKCADCHHDYVGLPDQREQLRRLALKALRKAGVEQPIRRIARLPALTRMRRARSLEKRREELGRQVAALPPKRRRDTFGPRKVLICGWYGTETLGDKAILAGVIETLRALIGPVEVTVASLHSYISEMTRMQMPELAGSAIVDIPGAIAAAGDQDLVVFGGGPIMAIHELADMEAIFAAAKKAGVSTLVAGCGVGPIGAPAFQTQIGRVLALADARVYRDAKSLKAASELGIDTSADAVAEDPAFTWLAAQPRPVPAARDGKVLMLGLRDFPWHDYAQHMTPDEGKAVARRFEDAVLAALDRLVAERPDLTIRPLPMCTNHFGDDDRFFYRRLLQRASQAVSERLDLSLLGRELPPTSYVEAFRAGDAMITMRFHSLVFALGLGLPAVAIDYTLSGGKVTSLAERFGVAAQPIDSLTADFLVAEVSRQLDRPHAPAVTPSLTEALSPMVARLGFTSPFSALAQAPATELVA
ncbi:MAG TPA: polysaccharide pyruvyl transferase family protein [Novosphingobium sp.]|nr:polysaccharide pyruvyl transferase family protein [Novosphingobium sp.]